jgi:DDHD domain
LAYRRPSESVEIDDFQWIPLQPRDQLKLNAATVNDEVSVECGRYIVNIRLMVMKSVYWKETDIRIVKGSWFWKPFDKPDAIIPFGTCDSQTIEDAAVDLESVKEQGPIDIELADTPQGGVVQVGFAQPAKPAVPPAAAGAPAPTSSGIAISSATSPSNGIMYYSYYMVTEDKVPRKLAVYRGYPEANLTVNSPEIEDLPVTWLVVMTHGIGEALFNKTADENLGALRFRRHCHRLRMALNSKLTTGRVEILPLEWFTATHIPENVNMLQMVTLPGIEKARDFMNFAVRDLLLYAQTEWQSKIINEIQSQFNQKISLFMKRNPKFNENLLNKKSSVVCCGHSLGSVILMDLLQQRESELIVKCDALFMFGAPVAAFLCARSVQKLGKTPVMRMFNIFHPHDPVAYRLEPLLVKPAPEPMLIPHDGGKRLHLALSSLTTSIFSWWSGSKSNDQARPAAADTSSNEAQLHADLSDSSSIEAAIKAMNNGERIDWQLQTSAGEAASEWLSAMSSHFVYWQHEDVLSFLAENFKSILLLKQQLP